MHLFDVIALLFIEFRLQRQITHADDGVHGRADFVAHIRQEVALGLRRLFSLELGFVEIFENVQHGTSCLFRLFDHAFQVLHQPVVTLQRILYLEHTGACARRVALRFLVQ